jgi:hypothetical protein
MAGGTIDLDEITPPEILDPPGRGVAFRHPFPDRSKGDIGRVSVD